MENQQSISSLEDIFLAGCEHHQNGRLEKALLVYLELLQQIPGSPLLLYNTGLALYELGNLSEAIRYYSLAISVAPDDADTLFNLALCYQKTNNEGKALLYYEKAIKCSQHDSPDIHYNMGCCYQQNNEEERAIQCYEKVIQLDQEHSSALNNLAYLCHKNGRHEKAICIYNRLIQLQPNNQTAHHMLSSLTGKVSNGSPRQYIEDVFNNYSSYYEKSLVKKLHYNVPNMLRTFYNDIFKDDNRRSSAAIDLGCGTGLSGLAFHDICHSLTGIDLSANMLAEAKKKQIYDLLVTSDIIEFLEKSDTLYDLIIAADVMTYMGDLERIFTNSYEKGSSNCIFCFSTETSQEKDIELGKTGRFKHSADYIQQTALKTGWHFLLQSKADLRMEKGVWIGGHLNFLSKQPC